jgi:putative ABC transport system ATP-binding protein
MHCIAGLDELTEGSAIIDGEDLSKMSDKHLTELRREKIGFIFQSFNLVPTLTAEENIRLPLLLGNKKGNEEWIQRVIDTVHLQDRLTHRPSELSGGQQQRVAVARALASEPRIILADEPTGNLDSTTGGEILSFMRMAVDQLDQTIVMVTHDPVAAAYADRIVFLADGKVVSEMLEPTAEKVLDRMKSLGNYSHVSYRTEEHPRTQSASGAHFSCRHSRYCVPFRNFYFFCHVGQNFQQPLPRCLRKHRWIRALNRSR